MRVSEAVRAEQNVRVGHAGHAGRRGHGHAGREPAAVARRQGDQEGRGARPRAEDDPAGRDGRVGRRGQGAASQKRWPHAAHGRCGRVHSTVGRKQEHRGQPGD